jgi:methylglutaconyl-CoA hydratase
MAAHPLEITVQHGTATLWLNRPEQRNALNRALIGALQEALDTLGQDPALRAVVLAGRGPSWCAGADLNWMRASAQATAATNYTDANQLAQLLRTLAELPKPTVARIHGPAFAGGLGLVCACDIAVAAEEATFCLSEVRLGLVPAVISPYLLRAMGHRTTARWALTGEVFGSEEALRAGLIHEKVAATELDTRVNALVANLHRGGPHALAATKKLLREGANTPLDDALLDHTSHLIAAIRASDEGRAGLQAMISRHKPPWHDDHAIEFLRQKK